MESSSQSTKKTKKTSGRCKIEMKRIERKSTLQVTFSKRRTGLFKKASELSVLCGSEIAILVQSPAQKMFAFGHPSSTIRRYLNMNDSSGSNDSVSMAMPSFGEDYDSSLKRLEYTEAANKLDMEKKAPLKNNRNDHSSNINKQEEAGAELEGGLWFDKSIEFMGIDELEEYLEQLKGLSDNVQRLLLQKESLKQTIDLESTVDRPQNILTGTKSLVGDCNVAVVNQPDRSDDHKMTMQNKLSKESAVVVGGGSLSSSSSSNLMARERLVAGDDDESLDSFVDSLLVDTDMFDNIYGSDDDGTMMQNILSQESEVVVGGSLSLSSSNLAASDDHIERLAADDVDSFIDSLLVDDEMLDFSKLL